MKIRDLHCPVTAAKSDWTQASTWMGFTPTGKGYDAKEKCQSAIVRQMSGGYVLEYITASHEKPNVGFENDEAYLQSIKAHEKIKGRLLAVHKLEPKFLSLDKIMKEEEYNQLQDMWARGKKRTRWSVAFPITKSYKILSQPLVHEIFSKESKQRIFARQSSTLRVLGDEEREALSDLSIEEVSVENSWINFDHEVQMANDHRHQHDPALVSKIDKDFVDSAFEGMTQEEKRNAKKRVYWLANKFIKHKKNKGELFCQHCGFDPEQIVMGTEISARTLLDVHHKAPIEKGIRETTLNDFELLCPICHRFEHAKIRLEKS